MAKLQATKSVIRRSVGCGRFDTPKPLAQLNAFYEVHRLYFNHFIPVTKRIATERRGSHLKKK